MRHASLISAQARTQRGRNARHAATYLVLSSKFNQPLQPNLIGVGSTFRFLLRVNPKNSNRTSTRLAWKSGFVPKTYSALQTTEATRLGFEPRTRGPKPLVLPLHHRVNRSKGMNQSSPPNTRILLPWSRPGKRNSRENWANHADRPTPSKPGFTPQFWNLDLERVPSFLESDCLEESKSSSREKIAPDNQACCQHARRRVGKDLPFLRSEPLASLAAVTSIIIGNPLRAAEALHITLRLSDLVGSRPASLETMDQPLSLFLAGSSSGSATASALPLPGWAESRMGAGRARRRSSKTFVI